MKVAKKRYRSKLPKFWQVLKQAHPKKREAMNAWTGLGPFKIKWYDEL